MDYREELLTDEVPVGSDLTEEQKREISLKRAAELKSRIADYLEARKTIPTGFGMAEEFARRKEAIKKLLGASEEDWNDWKWQIRNRISDLSVLEKILNLTDDEKDQIQRVSKQFRWAISPYYASLMEPDDPSCPVRLQAVPSGCELDGQGEPDPMGEEFTNPAPRITRRYPDRLIINVTNQCGMFCRHCQRRRNIGEVDQPAREEDIRAAIEYIRQNEEIRDVLITGGDPFTLSDEQLDWILSELDAIEHVEYKRIGTRTIVTLPQRITPELCEMLSKHHPLYINTQFNNPKEVTPEAAKAADMLSRAGIPLGNQAVLLAGINNNPHVMKKLNHELLKIRVRPYLIFHAKAIVGTEHFRTSVEEGIEIMEHLRGYTSGMAIPTFIINAPHGYGKTPIMPEYQISSGKDFVTIRTWEGRVIQYPNPK